MKFTLTVYAFLGVVSAHQAAITNQLCSTKLGPTSVKHVKTATQTVRVSLTAYKKICPKIIKTITPKAKTTTVTNTKKSTVFKTLSQETDTITTTITATTTNTVSDSTTTTSVYLTTVVTTTTPTSIISTSPGFTPIASAAGYVAKRDVPALFSLTQRGKVDSSVPQQRTCNVNNNKGAYYPRVYPQAVKCRKVIKTVTTKTVTVKYCKHNPTRTTVLPRKTATRFTTVTKTITSTVGQADATLTTTASTTATTITTTTSTETDTITETETQTSVAPSATFYAACASDNIVGAANGNNGIIQIYYNSGGSNNGVSRVGSATSPYDCCVACQNTANCIYSDFLFGSCEVVIGNSCDATQRFGTSFFTSNQVGAGGGFILSNGPCGQILNGGNV